MILLKRVIKLYENQKKLIMHFAGAIECIKTRLCCSGTLVFLWGRYVIVLLQIGRWFSLMGFMTSSVIKNLHKNVSRNYFFLANIAACYLKVFIALFTLKYSNSIVRCDVNKRFIIQILIYSSTASFLPMNVFYVLTHQTVRN